MRGRFQPDAGPSAAGVQSSQTRAVTAAGLPSQTRAVTAAGLPSQTRAVTAADLPSQTRTATVADLEAIVRADRPAFGADREYLLQRAVRVQ